MSINALVCIERALSREPKSETVGLMNQKHIQNASTRVTMHNSKFIRPRNSTSRRALSSTHERTAPAIHESSAAQHSTRALKRDVPSALRRAGQRVREARVVREEEVLAELERGDGERAGRRHSQQPRHQTHVQTCVRVHEDITLVLKTASVLEVA